MAKALATESRTVPPARSRVKRPVDPTTHPILFETSLSNSMEKESYFYTILDEMGVKHDPSDQNCPGIDWDMSCNVCNNYSMMVDTLPAGCKWSSRCSMCDRQWKQTIIPELKRRYSLHSSQEMQYAWCYECDSAQHLAEELDDHKQQQPYFCSDCVLFCLGRCGRDSADDPITQESWAVGIVDQWPSIVAQLMPAAQASTGEEESRSGPTEWAPIAPQPPAGEGEETFL